MKKMTMALSMLLLGACASEYRAPVVIEGRPAEDVRGQQQSAPEREQEASDYYRDSLKGDMERAGPEQLLARAEQAMVGENCAAAQSLAERALRLQYRLPQAYWVLGECYRRSGEWDKARAMAERGLSLSPNGEQRLRLQALLLAIQERSAVFQF